MKSGEVIAGISGVWDVMNAKEAWGADYGACKLPAYTCAGREVQRASFTGYKMMGVNAYSKNKDWACKLADWMTNEENQKIVSALWNKLYFTDKTKADYVTELAHAEYSDWQGYCTQT